MFISSYKKIFYHYADSEKNTLDFSQLSLIFDAIISKNSCCWIPTTYERRRLFDIADKNGDGMVDVDEFVFLCQKLHDIEATVKQQFDFIDKNKDGFIDRKELKKSLKQLNLKCSRAIVDDMMKFADKDGDGEISFAEFKFVLLQELKDDNTRVEYIGKT